MSKEIVKYNNKMNKIPLKNFEKIDMNFFYAICSKVKNAGSDQVEISFDDLKEMTGYDQSQTRLINDLDRMNSKLIKCTGRFEDEDEIVYFNLFSTFRIIKSRKVLKIRVNPDFTWLMNNIAKEFTSFELQEYVSLSNIYAKALYRLLKQWKTQGRTPEYSVAEFKELLATPDYPPMKLRDKVIKPAVEEIKAVKGFQTLWCEVVYAKKRGRPVQGYIFHFDPEDLSGQVSFNSIEQFDEITAGMTDKQKAAAVATANNILKAKKGGKKPKTSKNTFNNFTGRHASTEEREARYNALLEKMLIGTGLTEAEEKEFTEIQRERA